MEHTLIAQASPDIAPEGVINAVSSRIPMVRLKNRRFDTLASPLNGRILISGGVYGEMSLKISKKRGPGLEYRAICHIIPINSIIETRPQHLLKPSEGSI
jgi:hypothetical protein